MVCFVGERIGDAVGVGEPGAGLGASGNGLFDLAGDLVGDLVGDLGLPG